MMILITLLGLFMLGLYLILHKPKRNLPPGPRSLPIIGNVHQLDRAHPYKTLTTWAEYYGDILLFKQFSDNVLVVSNYELIHEVLVSKSTEFAGRPKSYRGTAIFGDDISFANFSPQWVLAKKNAMLALKMYGDGLANLEELSMGFIEEMIDRLKQCLATDSPVDIKSEVHECTTGIMASLMWDCRLPGEHLKALRELEGDMLILTDYSGIGVELELLPILRYLPIRSVKMLRHVQERLHGWVPPLNSKAKARTTEREPACVMESIILQRERQERQSKHATFDERTVTGISFNLLIAGTVTTSTTMYCLVAVLVNQPDVQKKITTEIHSVIGHRPPRLEDRSSLPYVEATILEILRYSTIIPLSLPHTATTNTTLQGYDIPEGTTVEVNLWILHHSEKYWDDPWSFKPERFLTPDGMLVPVDHINRKRLLAFGAGRRVCAGEVLARNRLFLLVTSLLQKFHFEAESEDRLPAFDPRDYEGGIVICPPPFKVRLVSQEEVL